jgi:hypothetical protein
MTDEPEVGVSKADVLAILADELEKMRVRNIGSAERNPDTAWMMEEAYRSLALAEQRARERIQRLVNLANGAGNA